MTNTAFATMTDTQMLETNAGKTYTCPFCSGKRGSFWSVYTHCLSSGCFKRNTYLKSLWTAGWGLLSIGTKIKGFIK